MAAVVPVQLVRQEMFTLTVVLVKHILSLMAQLQFTTQVAVVVLDLVVLQVKAQAAKVAAVKVVTVVLLLLTQLQELLTEVAAEVVVTHKAVKVVKV